MKKSTIDTTVTIAFTFLDENRVTVIQTLTEDLKYKNNEELSRYKSSLHNEKCFFVSKNKKTLICFSKGKIYSIDNHQNIQIDENDNIFTRD
jgi:exopolysaccharide biosynthesis protein